MIFPDYLVVLEQPGWQPGLPILFWNTGLFGEPSLPGPGLDIQMTAAAEIILVEELFHLHVPFGERVLSIRGRDGSHGNHRNLSNVDSVEILQPRTPSEERSQVDDAEAGSVNPPVGLLAALVGATVLLGSLRPGHVHGDLSEVLHDEDETKDGEN